MTHRRTTRPPAAGRNANRLRTASTVRPGIRSAEAKRALNDRPLHETVRPLSPEVTHALVKATFSGANEDEVPTVRKPPSEECVHASRTGALEDTVNQCLSFANFASAMALAADGLARWPNNKALLSCVDRCVAALESWYETTTLSGRNLPKLRVRIELLAAIPIDNRAAFILSRIDGKFTLEDLVDISPMHRVETILILYDLIRNGVVELARGTAAASADVPKKTQPTREPHN